MRNSKIIYSLEVWWVEWIINYLRDGLVNDSFSLHLNIASIMQRIQPLFWVIMCRWFEPFITMWMLYSPFVYMFANHIFVRGFYSVISNTSYQSFNLWTFLRDSISHSHKKRPIGNSREITHVFLFNTIGLLYFFSEDTW